MFNKISIYVLYASIGINDKLISDAMEKLGYFVGSTSEEQTAFGMKFKIVQFEPMCYHQKDETDNIKSMYDVLFHCDAVQAVGKIKIDVKEMGIDTLSFSSALKKSSGYIF